MGTNTKNGGEIMAKNKISRKKLLKEPDEFITFTGQLIQFGRTYQKQLVGGLAIFFIILITTSSVRYFSAKGEADASLSLSKAQKKYQEVLTSQGPEDALNQTEKDFNKILEDFSGKMVGKQARLIFADMNYNAGKIDRAIELYEVSLKGWNNTPKIRNLILNALGYAYEKKSDFEKALTYYEKVNKGDETIGKADALYNLARLYAKLGNAKQSKDAYQNLSKTYSDYVYASIVKEKI